MANIISDETIEYVGILAKLELNDAEKEVILEKGIRPVKFDCTKLYMNSITDYIEEYINCRYSSENDIKIVKKHLYTVVGGEDNKTSIRSKHSNEDKRTTTSVSMLMRYIIGLHMNTEEAKDFLCFCGKSFSPVSKEDYIYSLFLFYNNTKKRLCQYQKAKMFKQIELFFRKVLTNYKQTFIIKIC